MTKYKVYIYWHWGSGLLGPTLYERSERDWDGSGDLAAIIKDVVKSIAARYTYDCGDMKRPLQPYIDQVECIPIGETVTYTTETIL